MASENPELLLAKDFVEQTNCNIFLTGKAGTGKTTFLHNLRKQTAKRLIVTAPTGVAAINAGGVTLHSFFQMPFGPFVPGSRTYAEQNQHRMSREKKNIIRSLDLLVIDEISMVRADLLDCVDNVLRRHRRSNRPFGGIQLLMIGDLYQLPPVVKENEWKLLRQCYESPYFFSSTALQKTELIPIELKHIYRQSDNEFIEILHRVRNNKLDQETIQQLNSRYIPDFHPGEDDGYITLCTHNRSADAINSDRLVELKGRSSHFKAELEGDFPEHGYPTSADLELKTGAQVMFVRNDPSPEKSYFNGKIGQVVNIGHGRIDIRCQDEPELISVERATWENIEYNVDTETSEISQKVIGTFAQYPLKLAWAITIHKSQGLTFTHAVIDAQAAFAHGQVYVALSRCRSFEGLVLSSPLSSTAVKTDLTVYRFTREADKAAPPSLKLHSAKIRYQQDLLMEAFDFRQLQSSLYRLSALLRNNANLIQVTGAGDVAELQNTVNREIITVGENFSRQLTGLFDESVLPSESPAVLERLNKASHYFQDKISATLVVLLENLGVETDNKDIRKQLRNSLKWINEETAVKLAAVKSMDDGFSPSRYLRALSTAAMDIPKVKRKKQDTPSYTEADVGHPEMFQALKDWRTQKAAKERLAPFHIMHQKTLIQIAIHLPDSLESFQKIKGIGKKLTERYGPELVDMISSYRKDNGIQEVTLPEPPKEEISGKKVDPQPKIETKQQSLDLFKTSMTIPEIADKRGLTSATIENHLAYWVQKGEIDIGALVDDTKRKTIESAITANPDASLKELRETLDKTFSYGDLKLVQAYLKRQP